MKKHVLCGFIALSLATCALGQTAATSPASAPASRPAARLNDQQAALLQQYIAIIKDTKDGAAAVSAYAKGAAIDARGSELNNTYLRRLLQLGAPQVAALPASVLVQIEPNNSLAWAVLSYAQGRKADYAAALASGIRALEGLTDDASVLNNTGQLLAWYDREDKPPRLADATRRSIDRNREAWLRLDGFAKAFKTMNLAYDDKVTQQKAIDDKVDEAQKKADAAKAKLEDQNQKVKTAEANLDSHKNALKGLNREYWVLYQADNPQPTNTRYHDDLVNRIQQERKNIDATTLELDTLRKGAAPLADDLKTKQAAVDQVKQTKVVSKVAKAFRWDPPAVDGVVTDEAERFGAAAATSRPTELPVDAESEAAGRLKLAKLYISNEMNKKAAQTLQEIIDKYPKSKAAAEAKKLLETLTRDF